MPVAVVNIIAILLLSSLFFGGQVSAQDVKITFKDSTMIEDTYSHNGTGNYGRAIAGSIGRVALTIGDNYGNPWSIFIRALGVYDSLQNYSGVVIDSARVILKMYAHALGGGQYLDVSATGLAATRTWVEGNSNGDAAANCEMCGDSCRTVGAGTCADPLDWTADNAKGVGDTLGTFGDKPADSVRLTDTWAWGDSAIIYVDTQVVNAWKDNSSANQGVVIQWIHENVGNNSMSFYASEMNLTGRLDSIPYVEIYGHIGSTPSASSRRKLILSK